MFMFQDKTCIFVSSLLKYMTTEFLNIDTFLLMLHVLLIFVQDWL